MVLPEWLELKDQILLSHDADDIMNILKIDGEDLLDAFKDQVYNNLIDFDVEDYNAEG